MFAQLGEHKFEGLKTPVSVSDSKAVTYGETPLVNEKPVLQASGKELAAISLTVTYAAEFCDPAKEIAALEKSMNDCEVLPYILGDGTIKGNFVITDIQTNILRASAKGTPELVTVNITLIEKAGEVKETVTGEALASSSPTPAPAAAPVTTTANGIAGDLTKAKGNVSRMKSVLAKVKKGTTSLRSGTRKVRKLADDTKKAYSTAKTKLEATKKIAKRATKLPTSLSEALAYAENLSKLDDVTDVTVLEKNITQLSDSADKVTGDAASIAAFSATKEGGE